VAVHIDSAGAIWAAGDDGSLRVLEDAWRDLPLPTETPEVTGFRSLADGTLVAEGRSRVWQLHDETWETFVDISNTCFRSLRLSEPFGSLRFVSCRYYPMTSSFELPTDGGPIALAPGPAFTVAAGGVWVVSEHEMYATASLGEPSFFEGGDYQLEESWRPVELPAGVGLPTAYAELGDGTLLGVGPAGLIVRFAGGTAVVEDSGTTADLSAAWGTPEDGRYVVGAGGTVLFDDGSGWRPLPTDAAEDLLAVHGRTGGSVVVAGTHGFVALIER
jgi:hypothetical protein